MRILFSSILYAPVAATWPLHLVENKWQALARKKKNTRMQVRRELCATTCCRGARDASPLVGEKEFSSKRKSQAQAKMVPPPPEEPNSTKHRNPFCIRNDVFNWWCVRNVTQFVCKSIGCIYTILGAGKRTDHDGNKQVIRVCLHSAKGSKRSGRNLPLFSEPEEVATNILSCSHQKGQ